MFDFFAVCIWGYVKDSRMKRGEIYEGLFEGQGKRITVLSFYGFGRQMNKLGRQVNMICE